MGNWMYSAFYILIFCVAFYAGIRAFYHAMKGNANIRPKRRILAGLLAPFHFLIPGTYTETGINHWLKFVSYLAISLACVATLFALEWAFGKPPYIEWLND